MGSIASSIVGAKLQGDSLRAQGELNAKVDQRNAALAGMAADSTLQTGEEQAGLARMKGSQVVGAQRAGYAASGVSVDSGSAASVQFDSKLMADLDASTIKNNAARQAWGYQVQESADMTQAGLDRLKAQMGARDAWAMAGANAIGQVWSLGTSVGGSSGAFGYGSGNSLGSSGNTSVPSLLSTGTSS